MSMKCAIGFKIVDDHIFLVKFYLLVDSGSSFKIMRWMITPPMIMNNIMPAPRMRPSVSPELRICSLVAAKFVGVGDDSAWAWAVRLGRLSPLNSNTSIRMLRMIR
jgi:hypothetical protein